VTDTATTVDRAAPAAKETTRRAPARAHGLRIADLLRPHWLPLGLAFLAMIGETLTDVLEPWPIKVVVDYVVSSKPLPHWLNNLAGGLFAHDRLAALNLAVAAVAVLAIVGTVSAYAQKYLTTNVSQWVAHDLRMTLYHHIQRLSLADHDKARSGDLVTRVTDDIDAVQDFINSALLGIFVNLLTLVGMIGVMLWVSWQFAAIALSVAPVLFFVVYWFTRRIKAASRAVRKRQSELMSDVSEVLTSIRVVQAFAREDYEQKRFESESLENVKAALNARTMKARLPVLVDIITAIGTCLVLAYGARLALAGQISAGILVVFIMYLGKMYKPMKDLSKMTDTVSKAAVGYERVKEVLEIESQVRDRRGAKRAPRFRGQIEFKDVTFAYNDEAPVLENVSFTIEPGHVAAFVGASGAGKSTLASLMARFYDPAAGEIRIDGVDIRRYTLKSLRDQISFVLQDTILFRGTIWENIAYGKPTASANEIVRAAKLANAHEFIEEMPDGYDTMVGERGVMLSGGQRQRIAIARAIVRDTPILVLDEPTASLDTTSEQTVVDALERLMKKRSCVLIAHRLSTIRNADVIFVLQDAALVEQGTHDALLKKKGAYAELYEAQSKSTHATAHTR
jgi:subfamily B ATP-binding cassette protein MsbA